MDHQRRVTSEFFSPIQNRCWSGRVTSDRAVRSFLFSSTVRWPECGLKSSNLIGQIRFSKITSPTIRHSHRIRTLTTYLRIRSPYRFKGRTNRDYAILSRLTTTSVKESVSDGPALLLVVYWKDVWEHLTVFVLASYDPLNMTSWDFIDFGPCFGASRWPSAPDWEIFCSANIFKFTSWSLFHLV